MGFIQELKNLGACKEGIEWASTQASAQEMWEACHRGDWMLWLCGKLSGVVGSNSRKKLVCTLCKCVKLSLPYIIIGDSIPRITIDTAENYCEGAASLEDVRSATFYAAKAAKAAYAADAVTDAAVYAAYAATFYAAADDDAAANAADAIVYATDATYIYAAKAAVYAAGEREQALKQCAGIVREYYPVCPLEERD